MRTDRPGYQYRKRRDGSIAHYWNAARLRSVAIDGPPPLVRFPDDITDTELTHECQRLTASLRIGVSSEIVIERKRRNISLELEKMYRKRAREIGKEFDLTSEWIFETLSRKMMLAA